jgi:hypothetical protein
MQLLPDNLQRLLPPLYATEHDGDPMVWCKFFCPWNSWKWYVLEGEPTEYEDGGDAHWHSDYLFFGWVRGLDDEVGYFRLSDLESVAGPYGLTVERDVHFTPTRLSIIKGKIVERR